MTQLDCIKAFLQDAEIQQKYGLTPAEVDQMTMQSQFTGEAQILVSLIRRMVSDVDDKLKTPGVVASAMNNLLENTLR